MLTEGEMASFVQDGFVALRGAVPPEVIAVCLGEVAQELQSRHVDLHDQATWRQPVERINCPETAAFEAAGTQPALWSAYEQLLAPVKWGRRRGVGGTIPVRFPHPDDPGDAGWHIDGSFECQGDLWVNLGSRERGLLALFLITDVGDDDAPTEIKVGSHLDLPPLLAPYGDAGTSFRTVSEQLPASTFERPSAFATGRAGDVFVCHPFLVHRATWPHTGARPRAIAQPGVFISRPFPLDGSSPSLVERAIRRGLGR